MKTPSGATRVKVDGQGRIVLPKWLRRHLVETPGEVIVRQTPDGVLLTPATSAGHVEQAPDGLPVLRLGRPVTNDDVTAAIDEERAGR